MVRGFTQAETIDQAYQVRRFRVFQVDRNVVSRVFGYAKIENPDVKKVVFGIPTGNFRSEDETDVDEDSR